MKKTIFILLVLAFFSCNTDDVQQIEEEAITTKNLASRENYNDDQWGSMNAYDPKNREAIKIWVTYGQYNQLRREGMGRMEVLKVPNRAVYAIDAGRMNVGMPNIGDPLPFAGCNQFNDLAYSTSQWGLQLAAGEITLAQAIVHEQVSQQAEAYASGQAITFPICYNGTVVGWVNAFPDDGTGLSSGSGSDSSPMSGSWTPYND